ncbi:MAG: phosphate acetyltransferase [Candidatus Omnitrophica bacterium]|nr:phosphate acetyltransferase [Candidatus Omnitrophota bacterium]
MGFIEKIYERAKKAKKRILLPEGEEGRVLRAVDSILKQGICTPVIVGDPDKISKAAKAGGVDLAAGEIIDRKKYKDLDKYVSLYCEIRKHKNVGAAEARKLIVENPVFYSALAVRSGDADGFVAGASITTRNVARAAIHCIGPADGTKTISSSSIVILPDEKLGANGVFIYADAGIVPDPTAEQLCDIAIASAKMARMLLDDEPRVAMLSYSTKGSGGSGKSIEKVREATRLVAEKEPGLLIDGEIQVDCAVVPEVAKRKDPDSRIKGRANVFIFPNLDAGNIAYKLTERLGRAHAIGPILQGLKKPASDLSRGCSPQDIADAVSVVALLAQA